MRQKAVAWAECELVECDCVRSPIHAHGWSYWMCNDAAMGKGDVFTRVEVLAVVHCRESLLRRPAAWGCSGTRAHAYRKVGHTIMGHGTHESIRHATDS